MVSLNSFAIIPVPHFTQPCQSAIILRITNLALLVQ